MSDEPAATDQSLAGQETTMAEDVSGAINLRVEALLVLVYFALYLGYMFIRPENEWLHLLYVRTENNLLSCVVLHSFINVLPAMTLIKFSMS